MSTNQPGVTWRIDPRGPYIRMHSGREVYLQQPDAKQIYIPDTAYHMAGIRRYTGGSRFTNGQHSLVAVKMAQRFYSEHEWLAHKMLIHDMSESILNDVASSAKQCYGAEYLALEQVWDEAVEDRFNLGFIGDAMVKEVDIRMWLTERLTLWPGDPYQHLDYKGPLEPFPLDYLEMARFFETWTPEEIEAEMLAEVDRLFPDVPMELV